MRKRVRFLVCIGIAAMLLGACTEAPPPPTPERPSTAPVPTPTEVPTATPPPEPTQAPIVVTATPTATPPPTPSPTATPSPSPTNTATPRPTQTPWIITATPTQTPRPRPTATPTPTALPTATPTSTVAPTLIPTHKPAPTQTPDIRVVTATPGPTPTARVIVVTATPTPRPTPVAGDWVVLDVAGGQGVTVRSEDDFSYQDASLSLYCHAWPLVAVEWDDPGIPFEETQSAISLITDSSGGRYWLGTGWMPQRRTIWLRNWPAKAFIDTLTEADGLTVLVIHAGWPDTGAQFRVAGLEAFLESINWQC